MTNQMNEENIRIAAYYIWEQAGRPEGQDKEFWNKACEQLYSSKNQKTTVCSKKSCKNVVSSKSKVASISSAKTVKASVASMASAKLNKTPSFQKAKKL